MSGIAAVLNLNGGAVNSAEVDRLANALAVHGPHRRKIMMRGSAAFVFCLHKITPEDLFESQPLLLDNRFVLLFDGRIDNRTELGAALGVAASEVARMSDSLILLQLFKRWGDRAFERVAGAFAIIVFDLREKTLLCARDHMGLRVLHYHHSGELFAVATAPQALFALSWVKRSLSFDKIADCLVDRGLNAETTYYTGIYRVLPGSVHRLRGTQLSKSNFWTPEDARDVRFKRDEDYVLAFQTLFQEVVEANLRAAATPCATITGGLNSSSVAVVAADLLAERGKTLNTFTAIPEEGFQKQNIRGRFFDETPYVREIAHFKSNLIAHFVQPSKAPILEQINETLARGGSPSGGVLNDLWNFDVLKAAKTLGHTVMLTGDMGNHTMSHSGYSLLPELLMSGNWLGLAREIKSSGYRWKQMLRHWTVAPIVPPTLFRRYKEWRRSGRPPWDTYSAVHPDFAARSGIRERAAREHLGFDLAPLRIGRQAQIRALHSFADTADRFAQVRAIFGIDIRTPAFDRRLVEFCVGLPQSQYLRDGQDRWLIRRAMKGRLPHSVLSNRDNGVQAADWYPRLTREREHLIAEVNRLKQNSTVAAVIDLDKLNAILDSWPSEEPAEYGSASHPMRMALPHALSAARFIEKFEGRNLGRECLP